MKINNLSLLVGIALAVPAAGYGAGTASAPFLRQEPTARVSAMGGASAALDDDSGAAYLNPAGLANMKKNNVSFSAWKGLDNASNFTFLSGILKADGLGVFNATYLNYDTGVEDVFDLSGNLSTVRLEYDYALGLGWGRAVTDELSAGVQYKYVKSKLAEAYNAQSGTFDAGLMYKLLNRRLSLGAGVRNAGGELNYLSKGDPLPRVYYGGAAVKFAVPGGDLLLAADLQKPRDQPQTDERLGLEYGLDRFCLRLGGKRVAGENTMTLGAGVKFDWVSLDYGFEPAGKLDQAVHKFTLNVFFGGLPEERSGR